MADFNKVSDRHGWREGIGEGCARVFCGAGWRVAICDVDEKCGVALAAELSAKGPGECHFERADVRNAEEPAG